MCGIAGLLAPRPITGADRRDVAAMSQRLADRGPDGHGSIVSGRCVLAHRRLAIRDADGGRQPLASADGRVHLVYNGELYNDRELRRELGERFATACDTETVLAAYLRWGAGFLDRLRGMFALAIYDDRHRRLLLARDRCGVKPLFYAGTDDGLVFASTVAAVLAVPRVPRQPDFAAALHYLRSFRLTLGRRTLYEGVRQLQPGERLIVENGRATLATWATRPDCPADDIATAPPDRDAAEAACDELGDALADSVSRRLVADGPVGMFLSGGVDSAVLASLLAETRGGDFDAVAAGDDTTDELAAAQRTASVVGGRLHALPPDPAAYVGDWEHLLTATRLPLSTPSDVPIYQLARAIRPRARVVLGGEGADEWLGGYALPHFAARDYRLAATPDALPPGERAGFAASLRAAHGTDRFDSLADHFLAANSLLPPAMLAAVVQPDIWRAGDEDEPVRRYYAGLLGGDGPPERRVYRALVRINLDGQLSRLDSSTMLAGLEARVPYCDDRVIELAARLPWRMHLGLRAGEPRPNRAAVALAADGAIESKRLLRRLAHRRLPRAIASRPKASFPTAAATLLAGPLAAEVQSLLLRSRFARALFTPEALAVWSADPAAAGMVLWPVVNLVRWGEREFFGAGTSNVMPTRRSRRVAA